MVISKLTNANLRLLFFLICIVLFGLVVVNRSNSINENKEVVKTDVENQTIKFNFINTNDMNVAGVVRPNVLSAEELAGKKSIMLTSKGEIQIELFGEEAPLAVSNHIGLVKQGFYDGIVFHRREEGFVVQVGDPQTKDENLKKLWGTGGPGYRFQDEKVNRNYDRGIVAMANAGPNTNGSQFFIMLENNYLPPKYTIFGFVSKGMDVVDQIQVGDKIISMKITD